MRDAYDTYGRDDKCVQDFGGKPLKQRSDMKDLNVRHMGG
jgi:hypothetical protein